MKFHWFAEVTYPNVPKDFVESGELNWVKPTPSLFDPRESGEMYRMFIRLMQGADKVGFDGLAVNEHHATGFAMTPSPITGVEGNREFFLHLRHTPDS